MPAHKREIIVERCHCGKLARFNVFNTWNAPMGAFCALHADHAIRSIDVHNRPQSTTEGETQ